MLGPKAVETCERLGWRVPKDAYGIELQNSMYVANVPRLGAPAVDIYFPTGETHIVESLQNAGIQNCSNEAFDTARIEAGIPRFAVDMDENTLAPEALGANAISYSKGCYIGQEVIARIRTYGQVAKALRGVRIDANAMVPKAGDKIQHDGKEVGWITSAVFSPKHQRPIALGYVRKECNSVGTQLVVNGAIAEIVQLP